MPRLTKAQIAAKEKEARAASLLNQADPVVMAEIEKGEPLSDDEKERIDQAAKQAKVLGPY